MQNTLIGTELKRKVDQLVAGANVFLKESLMD